MLTLALNSVFDVICDLSYNLGKSVRHAQISYTDPVLVGMRCLVIYCFKKVFELNIGHRADLDGQAPCTEEN